VTETKSVKLELDLADVGLVNIELHGPQSVAYMLIATHYLGEKTQATLVDPLKRLLPIGMQAAKSQDSVDDEIEGTNEQYAHKHPDGTFVSATAFVPFPVNPLSLQTVLFEFVQAFVAHMDTWSQPLQYTRTGPVRTPVVRLAYDPSQD
jgi:hypothetical protein